jgi:hypothetical protein
MLLINELTQCCKKKLDLERARVQLIAEGKCFVLKANDMEGQLGEASLVDICVIVDVVSLAGDKGIVCYAVSIRPVQFQESCSALLSSFKAAADMVVYYQEKVEDFPHTVMAFTIEEIQHLLHLTSSAMKKHDSVDRRSSAATDEKAT